MLEPSQLPPGVHVEVNRDDDTIDVVNGGSETVALTWATIYRAVGAVPRPHDERATVRIAPGNRFAFIKCPTLNCIVTGHRYRQP